MIAGSSCIAYWLPLHSTLVVRSDVAVCRKHCGVKRAKRLTRQGSCRRALAEWFSVGLLHLERIEWEKSSAGMLEKVPHSHLQPSSSAG